MARLVGVDLPRQKRMDIALTYLYGIGPSNVLDVLAKAGIEPGLRVKDLAENQIVALRDILSSYVLEGDLRRQINNNIKRLSEIGSYRGSRHRKRLPARGQRTHTNARTKKGKRVAIAGKKKVTK